MDEETKERRIVKFEKFVTKHKVKLSVAGSVAATSAAAAWIIRAQLSEWYKFLELNDMADKWDEYIKLFDE